MNNAQIEKFAYINEKNENVVTLDMRYICQYPYIMKYLQNVINGKGISNYFENIGVTRIALYAITEFTALFIDDINRDKHILIEEIGDKAYQKYAGGYKGYKVNSIKEIVNHYENGTIDRILICSFFHKDEIIDEFLDFGISIDKLVTIGSVLFW